MKINEKHVAKTYVETTFPSVTGNQKAMLILAYGAGFDRAMEEILEVIEKAKP